MCKIDDPVLGPVAVNIDVLGMIENMSGFVCPGCDQRYDIFGSGGARASAEELGVPFLGEVPINIKIRDLGDAGNGDTNICSTDAWGNCCVGMMS